jgi:hypothetical protein
MLGECASNAFLEEFVRFTPDQENCLRAIGWNAPASPQLPHWYFEVHADEDLVTLSHIVNRTLHEGLDLSEDDRIEVTFCEEFVGDP